jgi:hypothetical protein
MTVGTRRATWDGICLVADGRNLVRASWGKIFDNLTATVNSAGSNTVVGFREEYDLNLDGTFDTPIRDTGADGFDG